MRIEGRILLGIAIILFGFIVLIGNLFDLNVGFLCWPMGLVLLGAWILLRAWTLDPEISLEVRLFGPLRREGAWQVMDQENWVLVGDVILDFTQAEIPRGETVIRGFGLVGATRVWVPEGVGMTVASTAIVTDAKVLGQRREAFLISSPLVSEDYETAERKIRLEVTYLIADVKVKRA
jgi:predicted membrane protein